MPSTDKHDRQIRAPWDTIVWGWRFAPRVQPLPAPTVGIFDEPCICLKLNAEWGSHFLGVIQALLEDDAWSGDENAVFAAQQQVEQFLAQFGGDMGCKTIFRQNPADTCQLEYSTDNGDNWDLAFDYSQCQPPSNSSQDYVVYQDIQDTINNNNNTWNNNPTVNNFAPDTVYDNTPEDENRNAALCYALDVLYDAISQVVVEQTENPDGKPIFQIVVGVVFAIGAAVITGGVAIPASAAIIAGLVGGVGAAVATLPFGLAAGITAGNFADAKEAIQCCMFQALANATVLEADFQTSLNNCGFSPGTNENVRLLVVELLQNRDIYLSFLKFFHRFQEPIPGDM
jgi:hypothetical protein